MRRTEGHRAHVALLALVVTVVVGSTGCKRDTPASAQAAEAKRADMQMQTVRVPVDGMICMVCAGSVKNALKAVHGVQDAEVNLEKHYATVQFERGKVSVEEFARTINHLGYKAGTPTLVQSP